MNVYFSPNTKEEMNTLFKLAQRNIWRNKRRTFITAAAIMFAVFFAIIMNSIQKGIWDNVEQGMVNSFIGYAQIHGNGYWEDQSLDYAFPINQAITDAVGKQAKVKTLVPRLEAFALASNIQSKGSLVIGIDPAKEDEFTNVAKNVTQGEYLNLNDSSVLVAEGLAEYLSLSVGDTIVLTSQGYRGANAAGAYPIKGLLKFSSPALNQQMVYLPLPLAQKFFAAEGLVSAAILNMDNARDLNKTITSLANDLGENYEVMDYTQLIPDLLQAREMDEAGGKMMLIILYVIITFGIFGTILMMVKERQYEFGVLTAIGMKRQKLSLTVWLETVFLGLIGTLAGMVLASPIIYYFNIHPIKIEGDMAKAYETFGVEPLITSSLNPSIFISQALTVFIIVTLLAIYPMRKISKLNPIEAMRT
jgi:putative ABC transport system permease protein